MAGLLGYVSRARSDGPPDLFGTNADPVMKAATWAAHQTFHELRQLPEASRGAALRRGLREHGGDVVRDVEDLNRRFRARGAQPDEALYDALRVVYADLGVSYLTQAKPLAQVLTRSGLNGPLAGADVAGIVGGMVRGIACSPNAQELIADGVNRRSSDTADKGDARQVATSVGFDVVRQTSACRAYELPDAPLGPPPTVREREPASAVPFVVLGAVVLVAGVFVLQRGRKP